MEEIKTRIHQWAIDLGFQEVGYSNLDLSAHEDYLRTWLTNGFHGSMAYMNRNQALRLAPGNLLAGSISAITLRLDYLPEQGHERIHQTLASKDVAYISRYALGRDYHKVIRAKLKRLAYQINDYINLQKLGPFYSRACTDSAPILEKHLAEKSGLGWIGKNTLLLNRSAGSWFFLCELLTNLPLAEADRKQTNHCGSCSACISICPTQAIVAPYVLDARKCISYQTIENHGSIPLALRSAMGNRIFGCDDCQLVCPWNRYAQTGQEQDFQPRHNLDKSDLLELFQWSETEFLTKTEGSAIRRTGYQGWLRNIAVALGNASASTGIQKALMAKKQDCSEMVAEHIEWAIAKQAAKIPLDQD
jgi:epoxyqueuosine reductase